MAILAKLFRSVIIASAAACGSHAALVPSADGGEDAGHDFGFVGSGGYGHLDGGHLVDDDDGSPVTGASAGGDSGGNGNTDGGNGVGPLAEAGEDDGFGGDLDASSSDGDGGTGVGVVVNAPMGFFVFLDWSIAGPHGSYSGRVYFGDAHSIEFVVGGIAAGDGYRITLTGTDRDGQLCSGTSAPFNVAAGAVTGAPVDIVCPTGAVDGAAVP